MESSGVRKGIWSPEEDILLRKCIESYGEGKWHLVPSRAGLNRCRKSCRLRWLNYLHPNIKRGQFTPDEVDLIIRLHKLLGNRWSLIAGRLPGRTGNDIKNLWNSHIEKKLGAEAFGHRNSITHTNILRPQPQPFPDLRRHQNPTHGLPSSPSHQTDGCTRWWSNLLQAATMSSADRPNDSHDAEQFIDFSIDMDVWKLLGDDG